MNARIIGSLAVGLFFIILGFLVRRFPVLIAGYNTMTKEQKEKIDIEGLSRFMQICLTVIGLLIMIVNGLDWRGLISFGDSVLFISFVIMAGSIFMVIFAQRYDHNKKKG